MDLYKTPIGNALNTVGLRDFLGSNTTRPPGAPPSAGAPPMATSADGQHQSFMQQRQGAQQAPGRTPDRQRELDARARAAGYRNYEEMELRMRQREAPPLRGEPEEEKGWLDNAMAWHPKNIFEYITKALRGAGE